MVPDGFEQTFPERWLGPPVILEGPEFGPTPASIEHELGPGETLLTRVSYRVSEITFDREPLNLGVRLSNPDIELEVVDTDITQDRESRTYTFGIVIHGTGNAETFDIQFVDDDNDAVLATIPVSIAPIGSGGHIVFLQAGGEVGDIDFGNRRIQTSSIHGTKWLDENGNGRRDREPGLPGVTIYVDNNRNDRFDRGEPFAITMEDIPETDFDEAGLYWIDGLPAGNHLVREVVPDGFEQTFPRRTVDVPRPVDSIYGVVPEVLDLNLADGETHLTRVSVGVEGDVLFGCARNNFIDVVATSDDAAFENITGVLEVECGATAEFEVQFKGTGEPQAYSLQFIETIDPFVFGEIPISIGLPGSVGHEVRLRPGEGADGVDFGNRLVRPSSIHGTKWADENGNGRARCRRAGTRRCDDLR